GTYEVSSTILLNSSYSGDSDSTRVTIRGYTGETVILSGGKKLTSSWSASGGLYNNSLSAAQFSTIPEFRSLYLNGNRLVRARSLVYRHIASNLTWNAGSNYWTIANPYTVKDESGNVAIALQSFTKKTDLELVFATLWKESRVPVSSISGTSLAPISYYYTS